MLTSDDLNPAKPYRERAAAVERELRQFLADMPKGISLDTHEISDKLYPHDEEGRWRVVTILAKLAANLPGISVRLPPEELNGRTIRRNSWVHVPLGERLSPQTPPKSLTQLDRIEAALVRIETTLAANGDKR